MKIIPRADYRVLRPDTMRPLPPEGVEIADDSPQQSYWLRREAQGDVEIVREKE